MGKRLFRVISLLATAILFLQCAAAAAGSESEELARAAQIGLDTSLADECTISGGDYMSMLDHFVNIAAPSKSEVWDHLLPSLRTCTRALTRAEGFVALACAAEVVGGDYCGLHQVDALWELHEKIGEPWDNYPVDVNLFENDYLWETSLLTSEGWTRHATAYFYAMGRYSAFSGKMIFSYDPETNSMNPHLPLTGIDAVLSVARLFDSAGCVMSDRIPTEEDESILATADKRRDAILNSPSDYTIGAGGTVYYVSPDGDDGSDGLTPETAWKTLDKVNSAAVLWPDGMLDSDSFPEFRWASANRDSWASLKAGDVVLFERDGQWRGVLRTVAGVTYSAYGEGAKPEILCSPENGAGANKWTLVDGTSNIWKFYRAMQDCGGILLDGSTVAIKQPAFWNGTEYIDVGRNQMYPAGHLETCSPLDITALEDLWFFNDIRYSGPDIDFGAFGDLYLRCDDGNPGEIYGSIEFFTGNNSWNDTAVSMQDNTTIDNLCIRYFAGGVDAQHEKNATVQNCAFLWGGGFMLSYGRSDSGISLSRSGDGIMIGGQGNRALNNYVAHTFDWGVTVEAYSDNEDETWADRCRFDCEVSGNLIESCSGGILMVDWNAWNTSLEAPMFTDMTISGNYVLYSGTGGWAHGEDQEAGSTYLSALGLYLNPGCSNIVCKDNVFYETWSIGQLVELNYFESDTPVVTMSGNTYVQKNLAAFYHARHRHLTEDGWTEDYFGALYDAAAAETVLALGDLSATVLSPSFQLPVPHGSVALRTDASALEACRAGAALWLAQYNAAGKLLSLRQALPTADSTVLVFPSEDTAQAVLLCLNDQWLPQTAARRVFVG